ncbi:helix-turn-helix transcriptional regulator [Sphaerimonospora thailandensis]|uniref:Transcriptional regulator n=1 Tax=Sphaerimonospora thailandensis TaxID=795644 RepID=A0A8J3R8D9_9ACTN|nr:helix-turn-helix domain-containing protein [Sphaerimonospora thailandensis]GIH69959.1 transcriptional regulator [Sphaerimonospora thailandensis]
MDVREVARPDPGGVPALNESRSQVLAVLQEAGRPLSAGEVAKRVRLHPNTARFHLDALVEADLAERNAEDRDQPGRPRILYTARPESAHSGRRSYRLLAEILAGSLAAETPQPAQAALRAGRAWGRYLADRPPPFRRLDVEAATRQLVRMLADIGFAPEPAEDGRKVLLHHCPFRETAEAHREVVCSIHLGLMQGLLAELGAPIEAERLDPFVEPDLCVARFAPAASPEP